MHLGTTLTINSALENHKKNAFLECWIAWNINALVIEKIPLIQKLPLQIIKIKLKKMHKKLYYIRGHPEIKSLW